MRLLSNILEKLQSIIRITFYGMERKAYPSNYLDELHYQSARIVPIFSLLCTVIWIPYLFTDTPQPQTAWLFPALRIGLSAMGIISFSLYFGSSLKNSAMYLLLGIGLYALLSTSLMAGMSRGDSAYMGEYGFILLGFIFLPIRLRLLHAAISLSVILFFGCLLSQGVGLLEEISAYSYNNLFIVIVLGIAFSYLQNRERYRSYLRAKGKQAQAKEMESQTWLIQEANATLLAHEQNLIATAEELQKTNENLLSSIQYAKRIQDAALPRPDQIKERFQESFIFWQPRDIVSGDFYFLEELGDSTVIAVADCTGHGIPGAFMSLIGQNLLLEIVQTRKITQPNLILSALQEGIYQRLSQQHNNNQDGMDIAICTIEKGANGKKVYFSAAANSLVYIQGGQLNKLKGDRIVIGGHLHKSLGVPFALHEFDINSPTHLYMYTDGYRDQFGGERDRKFGSRRLLSLLSDMHTQDMDQQHKTLATTLHKWQGDQSQIDDIMVLGVKLEPTS